MLRYLLVASLTLPGLLGAQDEVFSLSLPDLERSRERFADSPFGRCYLDPEMGAVRERIDQLFAMAQQRTRVDWRLLLTRSTGAELGLFAPVERGGDPGVQFLLRGVDAATSLYSIANQFVPELEAGTIAEQIGIMISEAGLVIAANGASVATRTPSSSAADLILSWNRETLINGLGPMVGQAFGQLEREVLNSFIPAGSVSLSLVPEGIEQRLQLSAAPAGLRPVDRTVLNRLPDGVLAAYALGIDGAAWWDAHGEILIKTAARAQGVAPEMISQQTTGLLAGLGIENGLAGLAAGFDGTALLAVGHAGGLLPSLTLALPRSKAVDTLINLALVSTGNPKPAEQSISFLSFPEGRRKIAPGIAIACDGSHWWLSTDSLFLHEVFTGTGGSWASSDVARKALAAAGAEASLIGGSDSQAVVRSLLPLAVFGAGVPDDGAHLQALAQAATRFVREAGPDIAVAQANADGWEFVASGPTAGLASIGSLQAATIIGAIAVPNLLESKTSAAESAAMATLKSGIFPAQISFSMAGHNDLDGDNRGEYAFLPQLCGAVGTFGTNGSNGLGPDELMFLGFEFSEPTTEEINGYHFQVWLPDGQGSAVDYAAAAANAANGVTTGANDQERYFVAYAWPQIPGETGNKVFAITQAGTVYSVNVSEIELPPAWNALFDYRVGEANEVFSDPRWNVE